jgi:hypothetical protein
MNIKERACMNHETVTFISRKSKKDGQYNGQKIKGKMTKNGQLSLHRKLRIDKYEPH